MRRPIQDREGCVRLEVSCFVLSCLAVLCCDNRKRQMQRQREKYSNDMIERGKRSFLFSGSFFLCSSCLGRVFDSGGRNKTSKDNRNIKREGRDGRQDMAYFCPNLSSTSERGPIAHDALCIMALPSLR
jgi:hypothetical protein